MNRTSVEKALKVGSNGKPVAGTFVWNPTGDTVTFTPKERLPKGTTIIVTIDPTASDLAGNKLISDRSYWYQTVPGTKTSNGAALLVAAGLAVGIIVIVVAVILMTMKKGTKGMKKGPSKKGGSKKVPDKKK
jgi:hypothetical protein